MQRQLVFTLEGLLRRESFTIKVGESIGRPCSIRWSPPRFQYKLDPTDTNSHGDDQSCLRVDLSRKFNHVGGLLTMVAMAMHVAISSASVVASMATRGEIAALLGCTSTAALLPTLVLVTILTQSRWVPSRRRNKTPSAPSCRPTTLSLTSSEPSRLPAPTSSTLSRLSASPAPPGNWSPSASPATSCVHNAEQDASEEGRVVSPCDTVVIVAQ